LATVRRKAYAAEVNVAFQTLAENNLVRAIGLLNRQRPKPGEEDLVGGSFLPRNLCRGGEGENGDQATINTSRAGCPSRRVRGLGAPTHQLAANGGETAKTAEEIFLSPVRRHFAAPATVNSQLLANNQDPFSCVAWRGFSMGR
jgi:hypothetical protein